MLWLHCGIASLRCGAVGIGAIIVAGIGGGIAVGGLMLFDIVAYAVVIAVGDVFIVVLFVVEIIIFVAIVEFIVVVIIFVFEEIAFQR